MRYLIPCFLALFLALPAASAFAAPAGPHPYWKPVPPHATRLHRPVPAPRGYIRHAPAPPPARWHRPHRPTVKAHPYPGKRHYVPWRRW